MTYEEVVPEFVAPSRGVLRGRVVAGAKLLDQKYPGWERRINVASLNLMSDGDCILGQLHRCTTQEKYSRVWCGNFHKGMNVLFGYPSIADFPNRPIEERKPIIDLAVEAGFLLNVTCFQIAECPNARACYEILAQAWVKEIKQRLFPVGQKGLVKWIMSIMSSHGRTSKKRSSN